MRSKELSNCIWCFWMFEKLFNITRLASRSYCHWTKQWEKMITSGILILDQLPYKWCDNLQVVSPEGDPYIQWKLIHQKQWKGRGGGGGGKSVLSISNNNTWFKDISLSVFRNTSHVICQGTKKSLVRYFYGNCTIISSCRKSQLCVNDNCTCIHSLMLHKYCMK